MAQYSTRRFHIVSTLCATSLHHEHELIPHETLFHSFGKGLGLLLKHSQSAVIIIYSLIYTNAYTTIQQNWRIDEHRITTI